MTIKEGLNKGRNDGRVSDKGARKDEGSGGASQKGRSLFSALFSSLYCQAILYVEKNNPPPLDNKKLQNPSLISDAGNIISSQFQRSPIGEH